MTPPAVPDILGSPHEDSLGRVLTAAARSGIPQAERLRRIRRKRFLESCATGALTPWIKRIRTTAEGSSFASSLGSWCAEPASDTRLPERICLPATKRASVVINTVDRAADLGITLRDLSPEWNEELDELIIVLGPCTDDSERVIRESPVPATLIRCPERNLAISRNLGLDAARGEFVVFLDDDASPAHGWLDELLAPFGSATTGVVAGFVMDGGGKRFLNRHVVADTLGQAWWHEDGTSAAARIADAPSGKRFPTATGCNMAFRRGALCGIGGFDPFYRYFLEETDAVLRLTQAGLRCSPAPSSLVRHRLGANIARTPDFSAEQRTTIIRSQMHYIAKFARGIVPTGETETAIWRRVLKDLEKIAWDRSSERSSGAEPHEHQRAYLEQLSTWLA